MISVFKWYWVGLLVLAMANPALAMDLVEIDSPAGVTSMAPQLTPLGEERAVLTWLESTDDGHALKFSVFDGTEFDSPGTIAKGDAFFVNWADIPGLFVMPNGQWLAHWLERSGEGTYAYDIKVSISPDQGVTWSAPFSPHRDQTQTEHGFVSYYGAGSEMAGMVWLDGRETAGGGHKHDAHSSSGAMTLRSAIVSSDGTLHDETLLDDRVCDCCGTASAQTDDGVVVAYRNRSVDEVRDIYLMRFVDGSWTEPVAVHNDGWRIEGCPVNGPAILAHGQWVVVAWFTMADDTPLVKIASSVDGGRRFGKPVSFDAGMALGRVDLTWTNAGYAMSWMSQNDEGSLMRLAAFDESGKLLQRHDLSPLDGGRGSGFPKLAVMDKNRVLITWTGASAQTGESRVRTAWHLISVER